MRRQLATIVVASATSALIAPAAQAVNLLVNASFELPVVTVAQLSSIPGWTRTCGTSVELQNMSGIPYNAYDGNQWWESDGVDNTCLQQTIATAANKVYKLTFAFSPRPGILNNTVQVFWNGTLVTTVNANGTGNNNTQWTVNTFNLVATSTSTVLELRGAGPSDALGGYIDGVNLEDLHCGCPGDADGNGVVNFADINTVLANFNTICP